MDNIIELAKELNELYEIAYKQVAPNVEKIIISKNKDISLIEFYLERLLDIPTDKSYNMLKKLCDYCWSINPEISEFYINEFEELYEIKDTKKRKKT